MLSSWGFFTQVLTCWLDWVDSNHRPHAYQACALTTWATIHYRRRVLFLFWVRIRMRWWRWWDSNPWPPACRAGALPTELHPHIVASQVILNSVQWYCLRQWYRFAVIYCSAMLRFFPVFSSVRKILQNWTMNTKTSFFNSLTYSIVFLL